MSTTDENVAALRRQVEELTRQVGVLEDIQAIRTLHFKYGYYMDKCLFGEIVELFAENAEINFLGGFFRGKAGAKRLYGGASGLNGPVDGMMFEHLHAQDIVDVAPDRRTAKGRFRCLLQGGVHESKKDAPPAFPASSGKAGSMKTNTCARTVCGDPGVRLQRGVAGAVREGLGACERRAAHGVSMDAHVPRRSARSRRDSHTDAAPVAAAVHRAVPLPESGHGQVGHR